MSLTAQLPQNSMPLCQRMAALAGFVSVRVADGDRSEQPARYRYRNTFRKNCQTPGDSNRVLKRIVGFARRDVLVGIRGVWRGGVVRQKAMLCSRFVPSFIGGSFGGIDINFG
jgi:hypothetical protein